MNVNDHTDSQGLPLKDSLSVRVEIVHVHSTFPTDKGAAAEIAKWCKFVHQYCVSGSSYRVKHAAEPGEEDA